jgi:hypothetical protein
VAITYQELNSHSIVLLVHHCIPIFLTPLFLQTVTNHAVQKTQLSYCCRDVLTTQLSSKESRRGPHTIYLYSYCYNRVFTAPLPSSGLIYHSIIYLLKFWFQQGDIPSNVKMVINSMLILYFMSENLHTDIHCWQRLVKICFRRNEYTHKNRGIVIWGRFIRAASYFYK